MNRALGFQRSAAPRVKLGSILLTWDLVDEDKLLKALAALHHCEAVTADMLAAAPAEVLKMLSAAQAIRLNAVPYAVQKSRIRVAFVNPSDIAAVDEVSALTGHVCMPGVATELRLMQAQRRFYGRALPFELRPTSIRAEGSRSSRVIPVPVIAPPPFPMQIPVEAAPSAPAREPAQITVPDLPIPPRLTTGASAPAVSPPQPPPAPELAAAPAPASKPAASRPEARESDLWIERPRIPPPTEEVLGMWSHAAAAPPPGSRDEIGDLALGLVPEEFPRVVLLADRDGVLVGWRARGIGRTVEAVRLPESEPSVFTAALHSGSHHFGRVEPDAWPEAFARLLDGSPPCAVFPVQSGHGVVAVLYADRRGAPMKFEDTGRLARAAAEIAALLARVALETVQ